MDPTMLTLNSILRVLRKAANQSATGTSLSLGRERSYLSKIEHHKARLARMDLEPIAELYGHAEDLEFLKYKWHEHQLSIRVILSDPDLPPSLKTLLVLHDADQYPKSEELEALVKTFEPRIPDSIRDKVSESQRSVG